MSLSQYKAEGTFAKFQNLLMNFEQKQTSF